MVTDRIHDLTETRKSRSGNAAHGKTGNGNVKCVNVSGVFTRTVSFGVKQTEPSKGSKQLLLKLDVPKTKF
jgi:hypothetical protein